MWCNKCDRSMGREESCGYGDYKCDECGTYYWSDREYDEDGNEIEDEDNE